MNDDLIGICMEAVMACMKSYSRICK